MRQNVFFEDTTDEYMALALQSGLMATFYFMQTCLPHFKKYRGTIINLASSAGTEGHAGWTAYAAAKEGIRALTRVAAHEWGNYNINVNTVCPLANTPNMQAMVPIGDCEDDIGLIVVFLASSDSDYITGHTLMVDGGQTILR